MDEPIVFISRNRVKPGRLQAFLEHYRASIPPIEAGKPGTLAQLAYTSDDGSEVVLVRLFPSAEALDLQLQGADERSKRTYEYIEPAGVEIYGTPSPSTIERMRKIAGAGISLDVLPGFAGGFMRLHSG